MRIYLDTNILAFLLLGNYDDISNDVLALFRSSETINLTSVVCVDELIHLCQIGKLPINKRSPIKSPSEVTKWLEDVGIRIIEVKKKHLDEVANLHLYEDHRDPNDRLIIAQAISDRTLLLVQTTSLTGTLSLAWISYLMNVDMGVYLVLLFVGTPCLAFLLFCLTSNGKRWLRQNNML